MSDPRFAIDREIGKSNHYDDIRKTDVGILIFMAIVITRIIAPVSRGPKL